MLIVAAAWSFYGAAFGVIVYVIAGMLITADLSSGLNAFIVMSILMTIAIVILVLFFWLRITLSVLGLSIGHVVGISFVAALAVAMMVWFATSIVMA